MSFDVMQITHTVGGHPVEFVRTVRNELGTRHLFLSDAFLSNGSPTQALWYNDDGKLLSNCCNEQVNVPMLNLVEDSQDPFLLQGCVAAVWMEMERA
jgi:hypothetical protein